MGPASHASYKAFPLCPEDIMARLGHEGPLGLRVSIVAGVVSMSDVARGCFQEAAAGQLEGLARRAGAPTRLKLEDLKLSREHVDEAALRCFKPLCARWSLPFKSSWRSSCPRSTMKRADW